MSHSMHLQLLDASDADELARDALRVSVAVLADVRAAALADAHNERRWRIALRQHERARRAERLKHLLVAHHALKH